MKKAAHNKAGTPAICHVPMALHLVSNQTRVDDITGNRLTRKFAYRQGYYDGAEREFRGFGLLLETDNETTPDDADSQGFTMPSLKKTWFHTGQTVDMPRIGYNHDDPQAVALGKALLCQYQEETGRDIPVSVPTAATHIEMARALSGQVLRSETFGVDRRRKTRTLYSVQEHRYRVRLLQVSDGNQSYARMLPLPLESITYQYEGTADDPQCQHTLNLQHDLYGALVHRLDIHYARRKTADDTPPFSDVDSQRWWRDAHDPAQQFYYLNETRAEFIHLQTPQGWRLGLPYRQRTQALRCPKAPEADGLAPQEITFETLSERAEQTTWTDQSVLTGLTVQRYKGASSAATLADGVADFQALTDHLETAELDETALKAFRLLPQETRPKGKMLERNHYHRMADFLPESSRPVRLWSVKSGFATYAPRDGFYKIRTLQPSESHGVIEISHDLHHCVITRFQQPDGCATAATYDYRSLQPRRITDPNGNVQEGLFDAFGQVLATSFYGDEQHTRRGFKPLAQFKQPAFNSPTAAISQSRDALQDAATALYYAPFSWMGCVSKAALADTDWLARCVSNGDLLPTGHICASARVRLAELQTLSADDLKLKNELEAAPREPVHIATLVADRDPDDDQKQIRIAVTCFDGFGRTLQSKQLVEPGLAYVVDAKGDLTLTDGAPRSRSPQGAGGSANGWNTTARVWRCASTVLISPISIAVSTMCPCGNSAITTGSSTTPSGAPPSRVWPGKPASATCVATPAIPGTAWTRTKMTRCKKSCPNTPPRPEVAHEPTPSSQDPLDQRRRRPRPARAANRLLPARRPGTRPGAHCPARLRCGGTTSGAARPSAVRQGDGRGEPADGLQFVRQDAVARQHRCRVAPVPAWRCRSGIALLGSARHLLADHLRHATAHDRRP